MELSRDCVEVEDKPCNNVWDITEKCTKSCEDAYDIYEANGGKPCSHYCGKYFLQMLTKALNLDYDLVHTKCSELIEELKIWSCDLFKKDETEWK